MVDEFFSFLRVYLRVWLCAFGVFSAHSKRSDWLKTITTPHAIFSLSNELFNQTTTWHRHAKIKFNKKKNKKIKEKKEKQNVLRKLCWDKRRIFSKQKTENKNREKLTTLPPEINAKKGLILRWRAQFIELFSLCVSLLRSSRGSSRSPTHTSY